MIGVKLVPPMPPSDEIVNVEPRISSAEILPSRALPESSASSPAISSRPLRSASLITGTKRPCGVSAAKPML